jgi:transposase-like protein
MYLVSVHKVDYFIARHYLYRMTGGDIKAHLEKIYNEEVSPDLINQVTDGVMSEIKGRQNRPVEKNYAIKYQDVIREKV